MIELHPTAAATVLLGGHGSRKREGTAEIEACAASAVKKLVKNLGAELRGK